MFDYTKNMLHIVFQQKKTEFDMFLPGYKKLNDEFEMEDENLLIQNSAFCLDGEVYYAENHELSRFARENLNYLQNFSIWKVSRHYYIKRKDIPSYNLIITLGGKGYVEHLDQKYILEKGNILFFSNMETHLCKAYRGDWHFVCLHFTGKVVDYIYQQAKNSKHLELSLNDYPEIETYLEELSNIHKSTAPYREILISNKLESMLLYLLAKNEDSSQDETDIPEHLYYLKQYIDSNYTHNLTLDFLSDFSGMSKYHLSRLFKKYYNTSPVNYIIHLRIEAAKNLLVNSNLPANKIAASIGIQNENYFYRVFKEHTGVSPTIYRKYPYSAKTLAIEDDSVQS